jgi:polycomb group RING finger protein 3
LEKEEIERQVKYYNENKLEYPAQLREKLDNNAAFAHLKLNLKLPPTDVNSSVTEEDKESSSKAATVAANNLAVRRNDEQIMLSLEPLEGLNKLERNLILCSCHCTITHLKKLVALKIFSNLDTYKDLDIVCEDEILGKDHTLKYIRVTKWKEKELPLRLNFRPKLIF